jgi:lipid-binding SYLF domain-containing protein
VLRKLPGDSGPDSWKWSAPLFIRVYAGSLGLTLGYTSIDSIVILDTDEAVSSFQASTVRTSAPLG